MNTNPTPTWLDLYDWRSCVASMYRERENALREDELAVLRRFRARKDDLFAQHPQSPLSIEDRRAFAGLRYFPYDPSLRLEADLLPETGDGELVTDAPSSGHEEMPLRRAALLKFTLEGEALQLVVYWIDVYGGGLFLPFRDATSPDESYGAGRYLFDTVKGSDFLRVGEQDDPPGYNGGRIVIDFNYVYNPSCAYDARWVCPLAPAENWLHVPIRAGELKFHD